MTTRGGNAQDQEKYFNDANQNVAKAAFYMQQHLDKDNLAEAVRHASTMINELRTSKLYPTRYYELYMNVTNELAKLEIYIEDEYKKKLNEDKKTANEWLKEWYNRVQYCGNIVPRLYLLITVGSICLKSAKGNHEEVMTIIFDLVGLTKGVQHPTRGLFLRNYLSQVSRLVLPDVPDGVTVTSLDDHPIVKKSVDFVLQNFSEMTRLWVRMQHQGAVRDRTRREKERLQLRMLVGTNLRRLSELNIISKDVYKDTVLKTITEQIVKCKDKIAQEYLMECIIMVFSDVYHLNTLDIFLDTVRKLHSNVRINNIIVKLMERLAKFAEGSNDNKLLFQDRDVFEIFEKYCKEIIKNHKKITIDDTLSLYVELINFASQCYPGKDKYIASMITEACNVIKKNDNKVPSNSIQHVHRMLIAPLTSMNLRVLDIEDYCSLINYLNDSELRSVATDIVSNLVTQNNVEIKTPDDIERLFKLIQPLIYDKDNKNSNNDTKSNIDNDNNSDSESNNDNMNKSEEKEKSDEELEVFDNEQYLIAKLISLINNDDTDVHYKTLHLARKYFGKGGDSRSLYTFPALVYNCLKLIPKTFKAFENNDNKPSTKPKKMYQFIHKICQAYGELSHEGGVRLWLQGALSADRSKFGGICFEFLSQACILFEESLTDSEKNEALILIVGTLQQTTTLDEENFDTLRNKCIMSSKRLLKKAYSCRALCLSSHLCWDTKYKNGEIASKLMNSAGKKANQMMDGLDKVELFVEVLNKYVYLMVNKCNTIDTTKVSKLINLIKEQIKENSEDEQIDRLSEIKQFFNSSLQYISDLSNNNDEELANIFSKIQL